MRHFTLVLVLTLMTCSVSITNGQDQDPRRAQRRAFVEDLLKGLIESQIEKPPVDPRRNDGDPRTQIRPNEDPRRPVAPRPIVVEVSREMVDARKHLQAWNANSVKLIQELRHHEYESPQLRPLLADALKLQANVELLSRKAQLYPTIDPLLDDFGLVDRDWRVLSHRLNQSRGLPAECSQYINSIMELDTKLCGVFKIQPQIDRRELQRLATTLRSDYDHLLQDLYYIVRGQQGGRELLQQGQQLQALIGQASAMISRGSYDDIVNAYRQSTASWKSFSRQLSKFRDERLRHSIADVEKTGVLIHEQLWLPVEIDREYLAGLANGVAADATRVFDSISLSKLMTAKQPGNALIAAREFQHACLNFGNSVSSGASIEDLEWDFRLFQVQWQQVHDLFHDFKVRDVDNRLEEIQFAMDNLGQTFGDPPAMDPVMLTQLTANLDALCRQISREIHVRCVQPRYDDSFHDRICQSADSLSKTASQLHQRILRQPNSITSANDLNNLFVQWRTLKPLMNDCQPQDKLVLNQYRSQIEPLMVKLQVVFAD